MPHLISLLSANDIPTARVYKIHLEAEGIECFLENENTVAANPLLANAIGGVVVKVKEEDAERAKRFLANSIHNALLGQARRG